MLRLLILAQSPQTRDALRAVTALRVGRGEDDGHRVPARVVESGLERSSDLFRELSGWIEQEFAGSHFPHDELVVLVDSSDPFRLNPIGPDGWDTTIAMLILAFPEIRWIFGVSASGHKENAACDQIIKWHGLPAFVQGIEANPLFDGSGLRNWVRSRAQSGEKAADFLPLRPQWAAAIDDEVSYSYLNAYVCYRFGFRAWAVTTDRLLRSLFEKSQPEHPADLTFEDLYLGLRDKANDIRYSDLRTRDQSLPGLAAVGQRCFVTTAHRKGGGSGLDAPENGAFIQSLKDADRGGSRILKPSPGIFTVWQEAGLLHQMASFDRAGRRQRGNAPGFIWPPALVPTDDSGSRSHSAPGRLLQVSEFVVARAERQITKGINNVPEAVHGAVLASSAYELLGHRTPTTSRDALELKHRFEVLAECQFGGVEFSLDLKPRFQEIRREMAMLGEWFSKKRSAASIVNGELILVSRLLTVFQSYHELDEAEMCLRRIRDLHRKAWVQKLGLRGWAVLPIRWYIEKLMGSTQLIFWAIIFWLTALVLARLGLEWPASGWPTVNLWMQSVSESVRAFAGGEAWKPDMGKAWDWKMLLWSIVGALLGFLHLGILIAHIYRRFSRT